MTDKIIPLEQHSVEEPFVDLDPVQASLNEQLPSDTMPVETLITGELLAENDLIEQHTGEILLHIEVIYALPDEQQIFKIIVTPEMDVENIICQSGILNVYSEIDLNINKVGVFGRQVKLDARVHDGDRIEIYRPLTADPKEIRRRRAQRSKLELKA